MLGPERKGAGEFGLPDGQRLPGASVDEVERDAREHRLRGLERRHAFRRTMRAAEEAERVVVERLEPERHAVHPGGGEVREPRRLDRRRIRLQRDLDTRREAPMPLGRPQQRRDSGGGYQRGRAAAEEDRAEWATGRQRRLMREVGEQRVAPLILIDGGADVAVEVAIGAFADAEGPVDVESDWLQHGASLPPRRRPGSSIGLC